MMICPGKEAASTLGTPALVSVVLGQGEQPAGVRDTSTRPRTASWIVLGGGGGGGTGRGAIPPMGNVCQLLLCCLLIKVLIWQASMSWQVGFAFLYQVAPLPFCPTGRGAFLLGPDEVGLSARHE